MILLRLMFLVSCLVLGSCRLSWADDAAKPRTIITLPYEKTTDGLILVSVTVNNATNAKFLLDTGTSVCFLSEQLADKLKLTRSLAVTADGKPNLNNGTTPYYDVQVDDIGMGSFHVNGQFGVMAKKQMDLEKLGADGMLGVDVLKDKALALYPAQHLLQIYVSGNLTADEAIIAGFGLGSHLSPIVWDPSSSIYRCRVSISGPGGVSESSVILDTGARMTSISPAAADAAGLVPFGANKSAMFNRQFENSVARVPMLKFGDLQVLNFPVNFTRSKPEPNHSLGLDVLEGYNVLMDFPASKVYLSQVPSLAKPN